MADNNLTSKEFFNFIFKKLSDTAAEHGYIEGSVALVPELIGTGKNYVMQWLGDEVFKAGFKGNTTGYYLALCANSIGGGMMYANAWADSSAEFAAIQYDGLYAGSVWENIFVLAEAKTDAEKTEFRKFIIVLFEEWVKEVYTYLTLGNAGDYLIESFNAFFQLGAAIRLYTLGY